MVRTLPLIFICLAMTGPAPALAQDPGSARPTAAATAPLEGKAFPGRIRARGIHGLFSVRGTLSFEQGSLVWTAQGSRDMGPYRTEVVDGALRFSARVPSDAGTYVDWSGTFDGRSLRGVQAIWDRTGEQDFVHDLFLPDVLTLRFEPDAP